MSIPVDWQIEDRTYEDKSFYAQQDRRASEHYDAEAAARGEFTIDRWDGDPSELYLD